MPCKPYRHERDSDGCNWDVSKWTGSQMDVVAAASEIAADVRILRGKYDIEFS
jgi:hypothetical protein